MQLILLAAGIGSRLKLNVTNKCFVKVCDKYLLDYNLEQFLHIKLKEIIIVVGHNEYSRAMKSHFRKSGNQMSRKWKSSYASLLA